MGGLTFNVDTNNFEVDGLHNRYHYWVHPYIKTLKNQNLCLVSFIRHVSGDYPPPSEKTVCTIMHSYTSKLAVQKCILVRNEMRMKVGTQKYQIQGSPIVSGNV